MDEGRGGRPTRFSRLPEAAAAKRRQAQPGQGKGRDWSAPDALTAERVGRRRLVDHLQRVVVDVRSTIAADQVEPSLRALARARAVIDALMVRLIATARTQDTSWGRLGAAIGLSESEAANWYRDRARATITSTAQPDAAMDQDAVARTDG